MIPITAPTKAIVGTVVAAILAFVAPIGVTVHAGLPITGITWFDSGFAAISFAALVFPSIYVPTNKPIGTTDAPVVAPPIGE